MIWSGEGGSSHTRAPLASTMVSLPGNLPLIGFWDMWVTGLISQGESMVVWMCMRLWNPMDSNPISVMHGLGGFDKLYKFH